MGISRKAFVYLTILFVVVTSILLADFLFFGWKESTINIVINLIILFSTVGLWVAILINYKNLKSLGLFKKKIKF